MSWKRVLRSLEADARRYQRYAERQRRTSERDAIRAMREQQRQFKTLEKAEAAERAANEAASFDNYLTLIVSVHKDCGQDWDWQSFVRASAPEPPPRTAKAEAAARKALDAYRPGFFERLFGGEKKQRALLEGRLSDAQAEDTRTHESALKEHRSACELWQARRVLGARVSAREPIAYRQALEHAASFEELDSYDTQVAVGTLEADAAVLDCEITDAEVVPSEEVKLTSTGKLSTKAMAAGRYWSLYQDYVCSCAIRVARETFAVLPISRVAVNIGTTKLDTSTGHNGLVTLLAVSFTREGVARMNLNSINPSDAMKNFPHRMKFKKTAGFDSVEPMGLDENWVSAG